MRSRVLATALLLCASVGIASCGSPDPQPLPVATQFVAAITSGDYATAAKLTAVPAATLVAPYQQLLAATKAVKVAISLGTLTEDTGKKHASAPFQTTVTPEGYAPWTWAGTLPLARVGKAWQVQWTPSLVHPQLVAGETFKITTSFGTRVRAQVLGAGGQVLVGVGDVYAIGITPGKMTDPTGEIATLAALLKPQGVTVADLTAKYTAGLAHPAQEDPDHQPARARLRADRAQAAAAAGRALLPGERLHRRDADLRPRPPRTRVCGDGGGARDARRRLHRDVPGRPVPGSRSLRGKACRHTRCVRRAGGS